MLNVLIEYAKTNGLISEPGFTAKDIRWAVLLLLDGTLGEVLDLRSAERTFTMCPYLTQPELVSGKGKKSQFLYETAQTAVLFLKGNETEKDKDKLKAENRFFVGMLQQAGQVVPELATAAKAFTDATTLEKIGAKLRELKAKPNDSLTFAVDGKFPLDSDIWHEWWHGFRKSLLAGESAGSAKPNKRKAVAISSRVRCHASGELVKPINTNQKITGLSDVGGQPAGDVLMGFDKDAFCSFGFEQALNAAISENNAAAYRSALNDLLKKHSKRFVLDPQEEDWR